MYSYVNYRHDDKNPGCSEISFQVAMQYVAIIGSPVAMGLMSIFMPWVFKLSGIFTLWNLFTVVFVVISTIITFWLGYATFDISRRAIINPHYRQYNMREIKALPFLYLALIAWLTLSTYFRVVDTAFQFQQFILAVILTFFACVITVFIIYDLSCKVDGFFRYLNRQSLFVPITFALSLACMPIGYVFSNICNCRTYGRRPNRLANINRRAAEVRPALNRP